MNFLPCTSFEGKKDGYYFGTKDNQTGYYLDHNATMSKKRRSRDVSFATTSTANIPAMSKKRPRDVAFSSSSSSSSATPAANKFNHFINTFLISVHTSFSKYTNNIVAQGITDQQLLCFATKDQLVRYCQVLPFHADLIINKAALIQQLTPASPIIITQPTSTPSKVTPSCEFKAGQTIYAIAGTAWYKGTIKSVLPGPLSLKKALIEWDSDDANLDDCMFTCYLHLRLPVNVSLYDGKAAADTKELKKPVVPVVIDIVSDSEEEILSEEEEYEDDDDEDEENDGTKKDDGSDFDDREYIDLISESEDDDDDDGKDKKATASKEKNEDDDDEEEENDSLKKDDGSDFDDREYIDLISESEDDDDDGNKKATASKEKNTKGKGKRKQGNKKTNKSKKEFKPTKEARMDPKDMPSMPGTSAEEMKDLPSFSSSSSSSTTTATDGPDGPTVSGTKLEKLKAKMAKIFKLGMEATISHERNQAMQRVHKLMKKYNIKESMLVQEEGGDFQNNKSLQGGMIVVQLCRTQTKEDRDNNLHVRTRMETWMTDLAHAMCSLFNVKFFNTKRQPMKQKEGHRRLLSSQKEGRSDITFYGINTNCQIAAFAYTVAFHTVHKNSQEFTPTAQSMAWMNGKNKSANVKASRNSWRIGFINGLQEQVRAAERKKDEKQRQKVEELKRQKKEVERCQRLKIKWVPLKPLESSSSSSSSSSSFSSSSFSSSSSSSAQMDYNNDSDSEPESDNEPIEYPDSEEEANVSLSDLLQYREARAQQVFDALSKKMEHYQAKINVFEVKAKAEGALVVHNKKIFETTLKEGGVKLTKGRKKKKRKVTNNYSAYGIGEEEGKNHNIHQKSIKDDGKKK